jgi:hypothetical protein
VDGLTLDRSGAHVDMYPRESGSASLSLDRKVDLFTPQPSPSSARETSWREIGIGAGFGLGVAAAVCGAALAVATLRRRTTIAGT